MWILISLMGLRKRRKNNGGERREREIRVVESLEREREVRGEREKSMGRGI